MSTCPICDRRIYTAFQRKGNSPAQYVASCYSKQKPCSALVGASDTHDGAIQDFVSKTKTINLPKEQELTL